MTVQTKAGLSCFLFLVVLGVPGLAMGQDVCERACKHLAECGMDYESCKAECATVPPEEAEFLVTMSCADLGLDGESVPNDFVEGADDDGGGGWGGTAVAEDKTGCNSVCQHVADCGINTVDACLPSCAEATQDERSKISAASCGDLKVMQQQSQPVQGGSQGGGGTMSDCSSVGGSLIVGVCSGPPFPCRSLGCPSGWSCAVDGNCHHNQYPNCMRCP